MPQRSVYIREEDDIKWQALENKAQWVHDHLNKKPSKVEPPKPVQNVKQNPDGTLSMKNSTKQVTYKTTNNWGA